MFITKRVKSGQTAYARVKRMVLTATGEAREETKDEMLLRLSHEERFVVKEILVAE